MKNTTLYKTFGLGVVALAVGASLLNANKGETEFQQQALLSLASSSVNLNDVTQVVVSNAEQSELTKADKVLQEWQLANLGGHPAEVSSLADFMKALSNAKVVELKTNKTEKFHRLGLRDISQPDSKATQIQLTAGDRTVTLLVGTEAKSGLGQYVRFANQNQTYLINSSIPLPKAGADWLKADILDLDFDQVRKLKVTEADKLLVSVKRDLVAVEDATSEQEMPLTEKDKFRLADNFVLDGMEGQLQYPSILDGLVRNLVGLEAKGVIREQKASFQLSHTLTLEFADDTQVTAIEEQAVKSQSLDLFKEPLGEDESNYWVHLRGSKWWYQVSDFDYKQLIKGKGDYLEAEAESETQ